MCNVFIIYVLIINNNNKGEEEKDRGFGEAWREVVTK